MISVMMKMAEMRMILTRPHPSTAVRIIVIMMMMQSSFNADIDDDIWWWWWWSSYLDKTPVSTANLWTLLSGISVWSLRWYFTSGDFLSHRLCVLIENYDRLWWKEYWVPLKTIESEPHWWWWWGDRYYLESPVGLQGIVDHKFRSRKIDKKVPMVMIMMWAKKNKMMMNIMMMIPRRVPPRL